MIAPYSSSEATSVFWHWYKHHADQRLRTFYFFVLFAGALLLVEESPFASMHPARARVAMLFGFFVTVGFLGLDIRNAHLVDLVKPGDLPQDDALGQLLSRRYREITFREVVPFVAPETTYGPAHGKFENPLPKWIDGLTTHKSVLRGVLTASAVIFLTLAIYGSH